MEPIRAATRAGTHGRGEIMVFSAAHTQVLTTRHPFRRTQNCRLRLSKEEETCKRTTRS